LLVECLLDRYVHVSFGPSHLPQAGDRVRSIAGYDTTAQTVAFTMWELAKHPEIQERLRKEVAPYQDQELSVDDIGNLKYLDAICTETCVLHTYTGLLIT
jgi:hypothetical protein